MSEQMKTCGELCRERVARWIIDHGYATGHGDTVEDMLGELVAQLKGGPDKKAVSDLSSSEMYRVALELRQCAGSWEGDARLLGNVRAADMRDMLSDYIKLRLETGIEQVPWPPKPTDDVMDQIYTIPPGAECRTSKLPMPERCQHGKAMTEYCEPCGRVHNG